MKSSRPATPVHCFGDTALLGRFLAKRTLITGLILAMSATTAQAKGLFDTDPAEGGFYVSGFVGAGFQNDADFGGTQDPAAGSPGLAGADADVEASFDTDVYFGGAIGYRLPYKFLTYFQPRLELEVSYLDAGVDGGSFNGGDQIFGGGQESLFILGNSLTEIRWSDNQAVVPYIGGGIGVGIIDNNLTYFPNNGVATSPTFAVQGRSTGLATHTTIGVSIPVNEQLEVYGEGRYLLTLDIDGERTFVGGGGQIFNADVDDDPDAFSLTVGLRYRF